MAQTLKTLTAAPVVSTVSTKKTTKANIGVSRPPFRPVMANKRTLAVTVVATPQP